MRYQGIHPGLDIALKYVNDEFLSTLGRERVSIKGDDVYAFKVDLRTKSETETFFENHHEYIDIHCLLYTSPSPRDYLGSRMPSSA